MEHVITLNDRQVALLMNGIMEKGRVERELELLLKSIAAHSDLELVNGSFKLEGNVLTLDDGLPQGELTEQVASMESLEDDEYEYGHKEEWR